ncbi:hypothetical protein Tco_0583448 [Tanacetum coccineum]
MKITVLTTNTPYQSRKIQRISACTSLRTTKEQDPIRRIQRILYTVFKLWKQNILEDIKRGPYSKKPPIRRIKAFRYAVFPLLLADDAKQWWIDEWDGKITDWGILVGRFFYSRQDDMRIDQMTKSALCHSWIYGWGNNESSDGIVSSDDEWEEYEYGNPPNTTTNSFFKPYMKTQEKNNIKRDYERSQTKRKYNNTSNSNNEQPNERVV